MKGEIERVLGMVKDGTLSPEQAAEMISALTGTLGGASAASSTAVGTDTPAATSAQTESNATTDSSMSTQKVEAGNGDRPRASGDGDRSVSSGARARENARDDRARDDARSEWRDERRRRRHHHRGRFGHGVGFDRVFDDLGNDIERAMGAGARTLRWALKSGLHLKGTEWAGESNSAVFSRADAPSGTDFVCEDNDLAVSSLRNVRLVRSTFSKNELNASSMQDLELIESHMTEMRLRGSSVKGGLLEKGEVRSNEMNGAGVVNLTINEGRMTGCRFNGAQVRDVGISTSAVEECRCNGSKLKTVVVKADSLIKGLSTNGVLGRNWLFDNAVVSDTQFSGVRVDGLVLKRSGLERVTFKTRDWSERLDANSLGLVRDLELQRVILKDCRFEDCRFDGTRFEGFDASNLTFKDVDFSGLVIRSADELIRLGARDVA